MEKGPQVHLNPENTFVIAIYIVDLSLFVVFSLSGFSRISIVFVIGFSVI